VGHRKKKGLGLFGERYNKHENFIRNVSETQKFSGEGAQPPPQNPPPVCFILTGLR